MSSPAVLRAVGPAQSQLGTPVTDCASASAPTQLGCARNWAGRWQSLVYDRQRDDSLADVRTATGPTPPEAVRRELDYLEHNRARPDYRHYRERGWFIGSGMVEAGCKRVIGQRRKQSGMFGRETGATAVASLRCALLSAGGWEHLWRQPLLQAA